ncbi:MAG: hypothetical protein H3C27_05525 [Opitutaceae bacterium]|nr:hypothetical protein [Opitutaceae bacterium]
MNAAAMSDPRRRWWRIARISAVAIALYVFFRFMPTGTNLNHMDFRVEGENVIEMCDPLAPQFLPVVNVRSPVSLKLTTAAPPVAGQPVEATLTLTTASGKPIEPADLLTVHTKLLHLLVIDPHLLDYHHVHPQPTREPGRWAFQFTPRYGGVYRVFADFTPAATGLSLYANTEVAVSGEPAAAEIVAAAQQPSWQAEVAGHRFEFAPATGWIKAGEMTDLTLRVTRPDGGEVPLQPIMGAFAHVVAFDEARTGFAHMHPLQSDLAVRPDPRHPELTFQLSVPQAGRYVSWAQVDIGGTEVFAPFWFDVVK